MCLAQLKAFNQAAVVIDIVCIISIIVDRC